MPLMEIIAVFRIESVDGTKVATYTKSQKLKKLNLGSIGSLPLFASEVIKVGRGKTCDVRIDNPAISLHHATIWSVQFDSDTSPLVYINDNSRNGVLYNGTDMHRGETRLLKDGDTLEFKTAAIFTYETLEVDTQDNTTITIDTWNISDSLIGTGSFGSVFVASSTTNYKLYAVKISKNGSRSSEFDLLRAIKHPNIITLYDAITVNSSTYLFQELVCGGDLFSYLVNDNHLRALPEQEAIFIVFQVMKALQFLHNHLRIVHRDLKLDNILLQLPLPKSRIYICDFGIAKKLTCSRTNTSVGTIEYSAPEVFNIDIKGKASEPYNFKCDTWSLGIVTHILLTGISPFYSESKEHILKSARQGQLNFSRKQFVNISRNAKTFLSALLQVDPNDRVDADGCFNCAWIASNRAKLERFYREKIVDTQNR
ncbi:hypothetical protein CANMA_005212 [Candida margitis]|uniref:uncharacterized protein n=1 Tax=Candida margitis TaxID=1775924 RepID=UPI002226A287|nr:uncharacterized protein CANMA_005212 [Candida margitis]KAI5950552.1 hypothetical protein CANMA_005212 [Candida margitis]